MSEGELVRQEAQLSYPRNTVDNIRELANSPQRGVYMWKDNSPGYPPPANRLDLYRSNPTSPVQQQSFQAAQQAGFQNRAYHARVGVPVYPPQSPQVHRKASGTSDARRRPMSFVRALEMSDAVEMNPTGHLPPALGPPRPTTPDRASVYDMNYEISV